MAVGPVPGKLPSREVITICHQLVPGALVSCLIARW